MKTIFVFLLASALAIEIVYARSPGVESGFVVHRYTTIRAIPQPSQKALLSVLVQLRFPNQVRTVGEALSFALRRSGYQLDEDKLSESGHQLLMRQPLPQVHRVIGPVSLADALQVIAGPAFALKRDDLRRTVYFALKESYKKQLVGLGEDIVEKPVQAISTVNSDQTSAYSATQIHTNGTPMRVIDPENPPIVLPSSPFAQADPVALQRELLYEYGPVAKNSTLWDIAVAVLPSDQLSIPQVMIAIRDQNPAAFEDGNINALREGLMLKIPFESVIATYRPQPALRTTRTHYRQWKSQRSAIGDGAIDTR